MAPHESFRERRISAQDQESLKGSYAGKSRRRTSDGGPGTFSGQISKSTIRGGTAAGRSRTSLDQRTGGAPARRALKQSRREVTRADALRTEGTAAASRNPHPLRYA